MAGQGTPLGLKDSVSGHFALVFTPQGFAPLASHTLQPRRAISSEKQTIVSHNSLRISAKLTFSVPSRTYFSQSLISELTFLIVRQKVFVVSETTPVSYVSAGNLTDNLKLHFHQNLLRTHVFTAWIITAWYPRLRQSFKSSSQ